MRFLKNGVIPFFAGVTIIISYVLISPWKIGADSSPYPMSIFNVLFTMLYLFTCCFAAFQYGKRKNKSGLFGLLGIWVLFYISLIFAAIPGFYPISIIIALIMFGYWTLFLITDLFVFFGAPAIMIILVICLWFIGKKSSE